MHLPDGFVDAPTSLAAGALAATGVALCLRRAERALDDRAAPLAGVVAAFVFAGQMVNVPVAAGTSGHVLGAALATVLVGPALAVVCITAVLVVQALLFADGGLSALGLNVVNMALVGVGAAWLALGVWRALGGPRRGGVVGAAAAAGFVSVPAAALAFSAEYALGGEGTASAGTVAAAMVGVHLLIGAVEAVVTALTVGAVVAARPDLVHALASGDVDEAGEVDLRDPAAARP